MRPRYFTKDMQGDIADYQRQKQVAFDLMRKSITHAEVLQKKEADDLMNNNPPSDDLQYKISQEFIKVNEREKDGKRLHAKIQSTAQLMGKGVGRRVIPESCCSICHSQLCIAVKGLTILDCGHIYHTGCIDKYFRHLQVNEPNKEWKCPVCRTWVTRTFGHAF